MNAQLRDLVASWREQYEMHGLEWDAGYNRARTTCADELEAALAAPKEAGESERALLQEVLDECAGIGCGPCVGSMAPFEDLCGRIQRRLAAPSKEAGRCPYCDGPPKRYFSKYVPCRHCKGSGRFNGVTVPPASGIRSEEQPALTGLDASPKRQVANPADSTLFANPPDDQRQEGARLQDPELQRQLDAGVARYNELPTWVKDAASPPPEAAARYRDDDVIVPLHLYDEINATGAAWRDRAIEAETKLAALAFDTWREGDRVWWQSSVGREFPGTILRRHPVSYDCALDDGNEANGFAGGRFKPLAARDGGAGQ